MNCLEYRRRFLADPRSADETMAAHRRACIACAQFAERQEPFERQLRQAIDVDVPAGLNAHILLRQTTYRERRGRWAAFAATVLLGVGISVGIVLQQGQPGLERTVLDHIAHEMASLQAEGPVSTAQLEELFRPLGMDQKGTIGQVRYASRCLMRRHDGAHLVLVGERGPVTVLVMPKEYIDRREVVRDERFSGVIVPAENGSIAVVGESGEPVDRIAERVRSNLRVVF